MRGSPGLRILAAVFDDAGVDVAVLDHHRIVEHGHVGHAAVAVAGIEIVAEHRILLRGRHRHAHLGGEVRVVVEHAPHAAARAEILDDDPHRYASTAGLASRPVGDRLAAAETAVREQIIELGSALPDQMGEDLALLLAGQVRARRGRGEVELRRIARVPSHERVLFQTLLSDGSTPDLIRGKPIAFADRGPRFRGDGGPSATGLASLNPSDPLLMARDATIPATHWPGSRC